MNPLTNVKNITKLNETELATGLIHKKSWHDMYKDSAWIFIGGLEYGLTEGDVIAVFSQYGEIENINLVRDKKTGKSKGYCFLCYSNQKSTVLAVDNLNGIKLCNRTIRVDHVANYKPPKENERDDEVTKILKSEGCAPRVSQKFVSKEAPRSKNDDASESKDKKKKIKKEKKDKKKKKRKHKSDYNDSDKEIQVTDETEVKKEKYDPGYDKYDTVSHKNHDVHKRKHREERTNCSNREYSFSKESDRSTKYIKTEKSDDLNKSKLKIKTEPGLEREHFRMNKNIVPDKDREKMKLGTESRSRNKSDTHHTSSKRHKRKKSPSSSSDDDDDQISDNGRNYRLKKETSVSKKHVKHRKKSTRVQDSSSSSSDDASSTQSSSEDEKHGDRYSNKDTYKTVDKSRPNQEDRNYYRTEDSYTSSRNEHYDKPEKRVEHKSRTKYKANDRDDSYYKDSYYQKKKSNK